MPTTIETDRIIPSSFFYSEFRNITDHTVFVWWAGTNGMNIPAGMRFKVLGDPRIPPQIPHAHGMVESIERMIKEGLIEFCSSPAQVIDDYRPNGVSVAIYSKDGHPTLDNIPLSKAELADRVLPIVVPVCSYDVETDKITVDWSSTPDLDLHDNFVVLVTQPSGKKTEIVCGPDRMAQFTPKGGPGDYLILVTLKSIDGREQAGTETTFTLLA